MNFADLITRLTADTLKSLPLFSPELAIVATIVLLLFARLFNADRRFPGSVVAILGTITALGLSAYMFASFRDVETIGMGGRAVRPDYICGAAGNAALIGFTNALGAETPQHNVRVFGINPAGVGDRLLDRLQTPKDTICAISRAHDHS